MSAEPIHKMVPVEPMAALQYEMGYIATIVALPFHDKRLAPDHLLHRAKLNRKPENLTRGRALEPDIVNFAKSIARAEYHVDHDIAMKYLS